MMTRKLLYIAVLMAASLVLAGCGDNEKKSELEQFIAQQKLQANPVSIKEIAVEYQLPTPVHYGVEAAISNASEQAEIKPGQPLQSFPLKSLQFVGTISENNQTWAYILTPDNMIYGAKVGDVISDSYGKIVRITTDHLDVLIPATGSNKESQVVTMQLKE